MIYITNQSLLFTKTITNDFQTMLLFDFSKPKVSSSTRFYLFPGLSLYFCCEPEISDLADPWIEVLESTKMFSSERALALPVYLFLPSMWCP